jgi:hypothetical protein
MTLTNALKKLKDYKYEKKGKFYFFEINEKILSFCINNSEDIFCINTRNKNDITDIQTDYFAETYYKNFKTAFESLR